MATAPSPNDLTRQQLDELDALLQRMLALPLNPLDGPPATAPAPAPLPLPPDMVPGARNWRIDPPAPAPAPAPHVLPGVPITPEAHAPRPPESPPAPAWVPPPEPEPAPPPPAPKAAAPAPEKKPPAPERKPAPPAKPAVVAAAPLPLPIPTPPPPPAPAPAPQPTAPAIPGPPIPAALWPFVALNWTTDRLLGLFGPPGWFLRSTFGKYLLGLTGLGLLAYTAAHVAQQHGWVALPVPLPWPR
jgi:hypothetical protein